MKQLLILIPSSVDVQKLDLGWPDFLSAAEKMPGLIRESITTISHSLSGTSPILRCYSFTFPDQQTLEEGLTSPSGQAAGAIIHKLTEGKGIILTADYLEDEIANINKFKPGEF
jgi:hypothetical protein